MPAKQRFAAGACKGKEKREILVKNSKGPGETLKTGR